jgi:uncharacterized protein (UPF0332 family)
MTGSRNDLVTYRIHRAKDTYEDAQILAEKKKWNSTVNRLYYAAFYAIMALLLDAGHKPTTHNGAKSNFSQHFILTGKIPSEYGRIYSQLFTWRQKGDYDDLFDFDEERVMPYFMPVKELIDHIEKMLSKQNDI